MDERRPEGEDLEARGSDPARPSAGAANIPPFEREHATGSPAGEGGRPPSHRELEEGGLSSETERSEERMHGIAPAEAAEGGVRERARESLDRISEEAERQKRRAAAGLETASRRIHEEAERRTEGRGGIAGSAGQAAHRIADRGEEFADYLRGTDVDDIRSALERQVREHPLQTLLVAVAAGWLIGKILR
jgi:hypothetical protein